MIDIATPSSIGDSPYFKPKEAEGELVLFVGGRQGEGQNYFGDEYTLCDYIVVLTGEPQVFQASHAEISNVGLRRAAEGAQFVLGRMVMKKSEETGKDVWTLDDPDENDVTAARNWWQEHFENVNGRWQFKTDPNEAPF